MVVERPMRELRGLHDLGNTDSVEPTPINSIEFVEIPDPPEPGANQVLVTVEELPRNRPPFHSAARLCDQSVILVCKV
jgi:hypothetical protein